MIPYVREIDVAYGRCDQVSPLIRRVIADNPGPFTFTGTGTYIVGRGEVAVIDPGPDDPAHLDAILAATAGERVSHILITHHHSDHSPLAGPLKAATGATIFGCAVAQPDAEEDEVPMEAGHDAGFRPDVSLCGGGEVRGPGWTIEAIPTPGHTSNHLCFALAEENALFSGDHIMGWSTTVITPPDGDMTDYLESLAAIRRFPVPLRSSPDFLVFSGPRCAASCAVPGVPLQDRRQPSRPPPGTPNTGALRVHLRHSCPHWPPTFSTPPRAGFSLGFTQTVG